MATVEAQTKQISKKAEAEKLLKQYSDNQNTAKSALSENKKIEQELLEMAEENPKWFDGKTANFENGQLKWVASSKVEVPKEFDLSKFAKKYPALVKVKVTESIQIAKLRAYLDDPKMGTVISDMGVSILTEDKFNVSVN